ncbi:unnamed protein product [Protopolystoma xenopodis]|uniref:Uncharacterized protein n=1 Tax=Protopolystoma xenopodis TaxID=117903 RepID=A0A448WB33_9PLAT|nr:unnamed protein product [Protopolystoma xenopodis]
MKDWTRPRQTFAGLLLRTSPDTASAITMVITQISSNDMETSCHALAQIDAVIQDDKWDLLTSHVNQFLMLVTIQLKQVVTRYFSDPTTPPEQLSLLIKALLATTHSLFSRSQLAKEASRETLRELFYNMLTLMHDGRTAEMIDGCQVINTINVLCGRILEQSNCTRILRLNFCSLIAISLPFYFKLSFFSLSCIFVDGCSDKIFL